MFWCNICLEDVLTLYWCAPDLQHAVVVSVRALTAPWGPDGAAGRGSARDEGPQRPRGAWCGCHAAHEGCDEGDPQVRGELWAFTRIIKHSSSCALYQIKHWTFSRLYPVIPANARVITDRDITVGGYLIPRNVSTSYSIRFGVDW